MSSAPSTTTATRSSAASAAHVRGQSIAPEAAKAASKKGATNAARPASPLGPHAWRSRRIIPFAPASFTRSVGRAPVDQ